MRIKFIVSLLPFLILVFTKIKENNLNKKFLNDGIIFLIPIVGLLFKNKLIMMTLFIICSCLCALYNIHTFKENKKNKMGVILHSIYYIIPIIVFSILYKENNMICYYITFGLLIYFDSLFNSLINKDIKTKKKKKTKKEKK